MVRASGWYTAPTEGALVDRMQERTDRAPGDRVKRPQPFGRRHRALDHVPGLAAASPREFPYPSRVNPSAGDPLAPSVGLIRPGRLRQSHDRLRGH
jgi:hypothetical protein